MVLFTAPVFGQNAEDVETAAEEPNAVTDAFSSTESSFTFEESDQTDGENNVPSESLTSFSIWDFIRMIAVLGIVIAIIYGVFYFLRKASMPAIGNSDLITILESKTVHGNRAVHLLEVGNQIFLVGSGDDGVRLISEITDKESADQVRLAASQGGSGGEQKNFLSILSGLFGQKRSPSPEASEQENSQTSEKKFSTSMDFIQQQRERLKKL